MGLRNIIRPSEQLTNSKGQPLSGGFVKLTEPGGSATDYIPAFREAALLTPLDCPCVLSGSGRAEIWINQDCDMRVEDRNGNLIFTQDNANPDGLSGENVDNLLSNGGFETDADSNNIPDNWDLVNETGSSNARDTSESSEGAASMRFTSTGTGGGNVTTSNFFPVNDSTNLRVNFDIRSTLATVKNIVRVEWYDISQVSISNTDVYDSVANPTSYTRFQVSAAPPANARFAKLKLIGIDPSVALSGSTYFDNVQAFYPLEVLGEFDTIQPNHVRAGNKQLDNGEIGLSNFFNLGTNLTKNTFETVGPPGSGATHEFPALSVLPNNARILYVTMQIEVTSTAAGDTGGSIAVAAGDDEIVSPGGNLIVGAHNFYADAGGRDEGVFMPGRIPLDENQKFYCRWDAFNDNNRNIQLYYTGFATD